MILAIYLCLAVLLGACTGYWIRIIIARTQKRSLELELKERRLRAHEEADKILEEAKKRADERLDDVRLREDEKETEFKKTKEHLEKRETLLDERQRDLDRGLDDLKSKIEEVAELKLSVSEAKQEHVALLEKVANLSRNEAREQIIKTMEAESQEDLAVRLRKLETIATEKIESRARDILTTSIHRLSSSTASELTVTSVQIPSEDIKGKIIGKEGRNIRTFERVTGVELIIDDAPDVIIISSFDPVRRQIARVALEKLIADGRIQPAKIEEFYTAAKGEINQIIQKEGEAAVHELGIYNLDPRLIAVLGRLHFRTSYGQNVLNHSIEMAHIAEMLASEIGADPFIAKSGALLHDIGKALDHEFEGGHLEIGIRILRKFGVDERVIIAMRSHHDTYPHESLEAVIVQTCDIISGGRPGARRDTVENYLKRLRELEAVANAFAGVERSYALQAGREIRVFVYPDKLNDLEARNTAREIALRVERELRYPGEIKITVIRENRIIEFAR